MKRDDDLLRHVLFKFEENKDWVFVVRNHLGMSEQDRKFLYHVHLAQDAGLVTTVGNGTYRLTNYGHDFLEAVRSDTVWKKTKEGATKIGGASIGILMDLAIAYLKQEAAEKLGIRL